MLAELVCSLRVVLAMLVVCVALYGGAVLSVASLVAPLARQGSLVERDGVVVGSALVAQAFTRPEYVWPRPSAVDYAADAAGGSNLSPKSSRLRTRVEASLARLDASVDRPAPAELVLASGSGLDPHLSRDAALWQAERVASARRVSVDEVARIIDEQADANGGDLVNVLLLDLALDERLPVMGGKR